MCTFIGFLSSIWKYIEVIFCLYKKEQKRKKKVFVWIVILSSGYYILHECLSILSPCKTAQQELPL